MYDAEKIKNVIKYTDFQFPIKLEFEMITTTYRTYIVLL